MNTTKDQRETAVKRELLKTQMEQMEMTPATQSCSSLSAEDVQKTITSVSDAMTSWNQNELNARAIGEIIEQNFAQHKMTYKGILNWSNRTRDYIFYTVNRNDGSALRKNDVNVACMIALLQAHYVSHNIDWSRVNRDIEWKIDPIIESVQELAINRLTDTEWIVSEGTISPIMLSIMIEEERLRHVPFIDWIMSKIINSSLQMRTLYMLLGDKTFKLPGRGRFHMLRNLFLEAKTHFEIFSNLYSEEQRTQLEQLNTRAWNLYWEGENYQHLCDQMKQILVSNEDKWMPGRLETVTHQFVNDKFIQTECQGLFDIKIVPDKDAFMEVFQNVKQYIVEQFGETLQFAKDLVVNVVILVILWNVVSLLWGRQYDVKWIGSFLSVLSAFVAIICAGGIAAALGKIIYQIGQLLSPRHTPPIENVLWANWDRSEGRDIPPEPQQDQHRQEFSNFNRFLLHRTGNDINDHWIDADTQAGGEVEPTTKVLGLLSLATITALTSKTKETWTPTFFVKQISALPRFTQGLECLLSCASEIFKIVHKEILVDILGYAPLAEDGTHPMIERFNKLMTLIVEADKKNQIQTSSVFQAYVLEAEQLGLKILQTKGLGEFRSIVTPQYAILRKLYERLGLRGVNARGQRLAPIIIQLYGETGQGKSTIVTTLALKLLAKICEAEGIDKKHINPEDLIYARNVEQEFWDGYHGQLVCVFDDFAQHRDFAQTPNPELFEIIRAGNTFPYPLHMADIADKNTTTFQSRIVLLTTNARKPKIESLVAPEAFYRRIDQSYQVRFNEEYCEVQREEYESTMNGSKGRGMSKVTVLKPEHKQRYNPNIQNFQPFEIETSKPVGEPINLDTLVERAFNQYNQRFNFEKTRKEFDHQLARDLGFVHAENQMYPTTWWKATTTEFEQNEPEEVTQLRGTIAQYKVRYLEIQDRLKLKLQEHQSILKALGILGMAIGVFKLGKMLSSMLGGKSREEPKSRLVARTESPYAPRPAPKRQSAYHPTPRSTKAAYNKLVKSTAQASDLTSRDVCAALMKRGMYTVTVDGRTLGCGTFVSGKVFLFPRHFLACMEHSLSQNEESEVVLRSAQTQYVMKTVDILDTVEEIQDYSDAPDETYKQDCVIVIFRTADNHKDRTDQFLSREEQKKIEKSDVLLAIMRPLGETVSHDQLICRAEGVNRVWPGEGAKVQGRTLVDGEESYTYIRDYWRYALPTHYGDCGGLLLLNNKMSPKKILGMHVMGIASADDGFSVPIYREDLKNILKLIAQDDPTYVTSCTDPEIKRETQCLPFEGNFHPIGITPKVNIVPSTSKIEKSEIHPDNCKFAYREAVSHPALLKRITVRDEDNMPFPSGTTFDPMHYRLEKCGMPAKCVNQKLLDLVRRSYTTELRQICQTHKQPIYQSAYSFEDAVLGIHGDPYVNSINRASAPGYGWTKEIGFPGKKTWFGKGDDFDLKRAQPVKERCQLIFDLARQNKRYPHVFIDTLKDERKPKEKWWKTRVFSACSQDYYIACKQYYQGVVGLLTRHRIDTGICVGINVYSQEWHRIVSHLQQCSNQVVAGDFENFDASLLTQVLDAARIVLNDLSSDLDGYEKEHDDIRSVLFLDLVHSTHLARDILYSWTHSLPSGHYLTAIVNSIYVNLIFRYLLAKVIMEQNSAISEVELDSYLRRMKLVSYGDDHVVAFPPEFQNLINQNTLPKLFSEIGMTYTDEKKTGCEVPDTRPIEDVTFLKRGFRWESKLTRYVAPLTLDTVLETPLWRHKSLNPRKVLEDNITWACHELALHDEAVFQEWTKKIGLVARDAINFVPNLSAQRVEYIRYLEQQWVTQYEEPEDLDQTIRTETESHVHDCDKCLRPYIHSHPLGRNGNKHKQFPYQCPNEDCQWYFGRGNAEQKCNKTESVSV